jgi:hypothetical protein
MERNTAALARSLIGAQSEEQVTRIVESHPVLRDPGKWRPYGGPEKAGTFQNQQQNAVAALTDKVINSIDALLLRECRARGIDPAGRDAPKTMQAAVEEFFGVRGADFSEVSQRRRRELAEDIQVIVEGSRQRPSILVVDRGEGQCPRAFPDTFLSLEKGNKVRIPFVQGKYNMGGTGALAFCGRQKYQLILSRRCPSLPDGGGRLWGVTLVRRHFAGEGDRVSWYEYCVGPDGEVMSFEADGLPIPPAGRTLAWGSLVKLYDYDLEDRSVATLGLWRELNRNLHFPGLPLLIHETRDFRGHSPSKVVLGNKVRIVVDERDKIESAFPPILPIIMSLGAFGKRTVEVTAFREGTRADEFSSYRDAVFFTINGQTHATLSRSFLENKAKLGYVARSLLVHVDCTDIDTNVREDIFMASRDRMRSNEAWREIQEILARELREHEALKALNHARREQQMQRSADEQRFINEVVSRLIRSNRSLTAYLGLGGRVPGGVDPTTPGDVPIETFEGKRFPTFLRIYRFNGLGSGVFQKRVPVNSYAFLKLETDACNDYLSREAEAGEFRVEPDLAASVRLWNGMITVRLVAPQGATPGQTQHIVAELTRPYDPPLRAQCEVIFAPPGERQNGGGPSVERPPRGAGYRIPEPTLVYRTPRDGSKTWADMDPPWTGEDVAKVVPVEDEIDIYINMDTNVLHRFVRAHRLTTRRVDMALYWYKVSIYLYSLVLHHDLAAIELQDQFSEIIKSVAKLILDLIYGQTLQPEQDGDADAD